jgi:exopolysaccharide biosynthesis WecB/TagA/CpsF family protein
MQVQKVNGVNQDPTFFLGVRVDNTNAQGALDQIRTYAMRRPQGPPRKIFFTNVHTIHLARRDETFMQAINKADVVLPDGSGLWLAGKLMHKPIIENLNGTDFSPKVLEEAAVQGWSVYLLGGRQGVAERCRKILAQRFPKLHVVGTFHGHFSEEEEHVIIDDINVKKPDILLVALGSPLQELWIERNAPFIKVKLCFAVGGFFDFLSGEYQRAPQWIRRIGCEWLYRFLQDPKTKWDRVAIEIPLFLASILTRRLFPGKMKGFSGRRRFVS